MIVDRAIHRDGEHLAAPETLGELNATCRGGARIAREVIGFHRATKPLDPVLKGIMAIEAPVSGCRGWI